MYVQLFVSCLVNWKNRITTRREITFKLFSSGEMLYTLFICNPICMLFNIHSLIWERLCIFCFPTENISYAKDYQWYIPK